MLQHCGLSCTNLFQSLLTIKKKKIHPGHNHPVGPGDSMTGLPQVLFTVWELCQSSARGSVVPETFVSVPLFVFLGEEIQVYGGLGTHLKPCTHDIYSWLWWMASLARWDAKCFMWVISFHPTPMS